MAADVVGQTCWLVEQPPPTPLRLSTAPDTLARRHHTLHGHPHITATSEADTITSPPQIREPGAANTREQILSDTLNDTPSRESPNQNVMPISHIFSYRQRKSQHPPNTHDPTTSTSPCRPYDLVGWKFIVFVCQQGPLVVLDGNKVVWWRGVGARDTRMSRQPTALHIAPCEPSHDAEGEYATNNRDDDGPGGELGANVSHVAHPV